MFMILVMEDQGNTVSDLVTEIIRLEDKIADLEDCPAHEKDRVSNLENCRENGDVKGAVAPV